MAEQKDESLLLRRIPYGETSLICHFLSHQHGRLTLMARGARRSNSALRASLAPLHLLTISWRPGRAGMGTLLGVERGNALVAESNMLDGLELMAIAAGLFREGDPYGFSELGSGLDMLQGRRSPEGLYAGAWKLLEQAGLIGPWDHCWHCGCQVSAEAPMFWNQARLVCAQCGSDSMLSPGLRKGIQGVLQQPNVRLSGRDAEQWRVMIGLVLKSHDVKLPDRFKV